MNIRHIDIHSHLTFPDFDMDREQVIARMKDEGIATITVGTDVKASQAALELAKRHDHLYATVGIHPTHGEAFDEEVFSKLAEHPKVVAIGECGLDYFRIEPDDEDTKHAQRALFESHILLAKKHGLPLMIHGRPRKGTMDAYEDILSILANHKGVRGNIHFFVGDVATAQRFLDIGFSMSFDGPVTFSHDYDEVIRYIPEDRLMAETDSPFASPEPFRGRRNEPLHVPYIVEALARARSANLEVFREVMVANAKRFFKLT